MRSQLIHGGRAGTRRRCSLCGASVPVNTLTEGKCGACVVQPPLPLRDNQGRFVSFPLLPDSAGTRGGLVMAGGLL